VDGDAAGRLKQQREMVGSKPAAVFRRQCEVSSIGQSPIGVNVPSAVRILTAGESAGLAESSGELGARTITGTRHHFREIILMRRLKERERGGGLREPRRSRGYADTVEETG